MQSHWMKSLLILAIGLMGCGGDSEESPTGPGSLKTRSPEEARRELGTLGIQYDTESFIKAVENGDSLAVSLFVDAGMDPNLEFYDERRDEDQPVLMVAMNNNKIGVVRVLLDKGADIDINFFLMMVERGYIEIVRLLLDKGADVNATTVGGYTVLQEAASEGHVEIVKLLLDRGAKDTTAALIEAVESNEIEVVRVLLDKGVDVNATTENYGTALMVAASEGDVEILRLLLARGADVTIKTNDGWTALMSGVQSNNAEIIEILLESGADVNSKTESGETALALAGAKDEEIVKLLLDKGASINPASKSDEFALARAAEYGHLSVVQLLLDRGADINAQGKGYSYRFVNEFPYREVQEIYGWTALMGAVINYSGIEIVKLLLDRGADVNIRNDLGETALGVARTTEKIYKSLNDHSYVEYSYYLYSDEVDQVTEIIQMLLAAGATE